MKKLIFFFLSATAFAALPPLAESIRELQALLSDHRFYDSLGNAELIQEIIRLEDGYLIRTQNYEMKVGIQYGNGDSRVIGPVHFEFDFQKPSVRSFQAEEPLN